MWLGKTVQRKRREGGRENWVNVSRHRETLSIILNPSFFYCLWKWRPNNSSSQVSVPPVYSPLPHPHCVPRRLRSGLLQARAPWLYSQSILTLHTKHITSQLSSCSEGLLLSGPTPPVLQELCSVTLFSWSDLSFTVFKPPGCTVLPLDQSRFSS